MHHQTPTDHRHQPTPDSECLVRPNRPQQPSTASTILLDLEAPTKEGLRDLVCRVQALAELVEVRCVCG